MAAVLGISAHYHDAAAALVVDGRIVAAIQEERLSRIKNDPSLPVRAARACLRIAGLAPGDLDAVVHYESPYAKLDRVLVGLLRTYPRSWRQFPRALGSQLGSKLWVLDDIAAGLDIERRKVEFCGHHESHAASAFLAGPFARAAIVVADAVGEDESTTIWRGDGDRLERLASIEFPHSLGLLYAAITAYLGFEVNEGEYKVMGLAAHGQPRLRDEFAKLIAIARDGSYQLGLPYFAYMTGTELGFGPRLEQLLGPRRMPGVDWDLGSERDRRYADVAATAQAVIEDAMLGIAVRARELSGCDRLCLAGGVALNCVANARIARQAGFERVFVQPAAGDAGGALGAALLGALARGDARPPAMATCALGEPIDAGRAGELAASLGFGVRRAADPANEIAALIERGKIVAAAFGRFEWGPRALGQRSILSAPRDVAVRERINRAVKQREPFRPFAPAVTAGKAGALFAGAPDDMTPFMTTVCDVADAARAELAAVTHEDGTARVQTVTEASAPALSAILTRVENLTGTPVVLNTSLNARGEPIVGGASDAVGFFARHPVDALVIEDVVIERRGDA